MGIRIKIIAFLTLLIILFVGSVYLVRLNKPIEADTLVIEGWLSEETLKKIAANVISDRYKNIYTTGLYINKYYPMTMDGDLIFKPNFKGFPKKHSKHIFEVDLYSQTGGENRCHFWFLLNDSILGDYYATRKRKYYEFAWEGDITKVDSMLIRFDNDKVYGKLDRNLYVNKIIINDTFEIPYQNYSVYQIRSNSERRINDCTTFAELARKTLIRTGIDTTKVMSVPISDISLNRTYSSAISFREFIRENELEINNLNVITIAPHSRRTYKTYRKVLDYDNIQVGVIALQTETENFSSIELIKQYIVEILDLYYYSILLLFK